jgi:hypothetical protein
MNALGKFDHGFLIAVEGNTLASGIIQQRQREARDRLLSFFRVRRSGGAGVVKVFCCCCFAASVPR